MPKTDSTIIQSLDRGLQLLEQLGSAPHHRFTLAELTARMKLDQSSVFRMLKTLERRGLVRQEEGERTFLLGLGIYRLATSLQKQLKLIDQANPLLRQLVRHTGETAHLVVRSGQKCVFIDSESATETVSIYHQIGHTDELYCTAVGKCLLSGFGESGLRDLFRGMKWNRYTRLTVMSPEKLALEMEKVRKQGYATDIEERVVGVQCVAAPVYNFQNRVVAAIGISGPADRMRGKFSKMIPMVEKAGRQLTGLLQGSRG